MRSILKLFSNTSSYRKEKRIINLSARMPQQVNKSLKSNDSPHSQTWPIHPFISKIIQINRTKGIKKINKSRISWEPRKLFSARMKVINIIHQILTGHQIPPQGTLILTKIPYAYHRPAVQFQRNK